MCTCVCQCACVSVALLAPAGLESHPRGMGRSQACELGSFPSLWHQSPEPPHQLCRGLGLGRGAPGRGQEALGGPWSRQWRPGRSSSPGEHWARPGSAGSALGADGRVGLPGRQPQGRPRKVPGQRWTVAQVPTGERVSLCPRHGRARRQQVNPKEGRKGRLSYQDCLAQPPLCLPRATCPQEHLGTVGVDLHSRARWKLLETF